MTADEWRVESVGEWRMEHLKLIHPCFPSFSEQPENSHSKTIFKPVITLFFISRDKFCLKLSSPVRSPVNLGWFPANLILKDRIIHFISFHWMFSIWPDTSFFPISRVLFGSGTSSSSSSSSQPRHASSQSHQPWTTQVEQTTITVRTTLM